jgi:hypothetical protein
MRGVKIGNKKGEGSKKQGMNIFEMTKSKNEVSGDESAAQALKEAEEIKRKALTDEMLGI